MGGKYKLLPQILPLFPQDIDTFIDVFAGGGNVSVNVKANQYIINDKESRVIELLSAMRTYKIDHILNEINNYIKRYELDKENATGYIQCRDDYNKSENKDIIHFYTLICHSFSNQIRFNSKGGFNMPFGKRTFNPKMEENLRAFVKGLQSKETYFQSVDFRDLEYDRLKENDFLYFDPPYLITTAAYNEQGGWTKTDESHLLSLLNDLNDTGIKFALSNVFENKGKKNEMLIEWSKDYKVNYLNNTYTNVSYQSKDRGEHTTVEVLVTNY